MTEPTETSRPPRASLVIPTLDGVRGGAVAKLLDSVHGQTFQDFELHLIRGVSPQGKAINQGAAQARGEVLIVLDDDSCLADGTVLQRLIDAVDAEPEIGMAGASIVPAPGAGRFQVRASKQFPRFNMPVVDTITDSDLACHGCCAIPMSAFKEVGGEREDLIRGLDPDLRVRLREAGYRVVLVPHARIYHPLPEGWRRLLRIFFRNGFGSAYAHKFQPDSVYETHETLDVASFRPQTSLAYRVGRFPFRLLRALLTGNLLRFGAYCAYACGYLWGKLTAKEASIGGR